MRIRTGFVSNSSSSSFIVAFPKMPESPEEVREMLNLPDNFEHSAYNNHGNAAIIDEICCRVYNDILSHLEKVRILEQEHPIIILLAEMQCSVDLVMTRYYTDLMNNDPQRASEIRDALEYITGLYELDIVEEYKQRYPDRFVIELRYADDSGHFEGIMEHSEIFRNLPYHRESYH